MTKPNFFILGAPKCGTTSLAAWLSDHPNIYMCPVKEPFYFNYDVHQRRTTSLADYESLFENATREHKVIGEATTWYLYSKTAVPAIEAYSPNSRYVVMVRNPVDMAYSLHGHRFAHLVEDIPDFEHAWKLQQTRKNGNHIPKYCTDPDTLQYGQVCKVGWQIHRLLQYVNRDRVMVIILDDIKKTSRKEYLRILDFLSVPDDKRVDFPIRNAAKTMRSKAVGRILMRISQVKNRLADNVGYNKRIGLYKLFAELNLFQRSRLPMPLNMKYHLQEYFREDVLLLSMLLNRNLMDWVEEST